ncbi:hypothetical protein D3C80_1776770 [compost metagenome]
MRAASEQIVRDTLWCCLQTVIGHTVHGIKKAIRQALHDGLRDTGLLLDHVADTRQLETR